MPLDNCEPRGSVILSSLSLGFWIFLFNMGPFQYPTHSRNLKNQLTSSWKHAEITPRQPLYWVVTSTPMESIGTPFRFYLTAGRNQSERKIIDIFYKCGLSQLQTAPTRIGAMLDLSATNGPWLVKNMNNIPGIADHDTLLIDSDIQTISSKKPHRKVLKWSQGNCNELGKDTAEFAQKYFSEEDTRSSEENYAAIDRHLKTALNKHISSGYTRTCITAVRRAGV